jgi:hypothetical protein
VLTEQVWVNATWSESAGGGIIPWSDVADDPRRFASGFGNPDNRKDGEVADLEITYSGAFEVPGESGLALIFQRDGGMGGVFLIEAEFAEDPYEWPWIVDEINFAELLSDVVDEGTEFIKAIKVSPDSSAAYIVTSILTMKISEDFISGDVVFDSADDILNSDAVAYAPYLGADATTIELAGAGADEIVYLGTKNGLYSASTSADPAEFFDGGASLVTGTSGYYIKLISASPDGEKVAFVARRGSNPDFLVVIDNQSIVDVRGLQGLPGTRLSNLVWLDEDTLAISGDHGMAVTNVNLLF